MKKIDNRAVGQPEMMYQYFELCQLAKYPEITIKINTELGNDYAEAEVYFDGEYVDTFIIKEIIEDIVSRNISPMKDVRKKEAKRRKKRIAQNKCPRCFQQLKEKRYCELCKKYYDENGDVKNAVA